VRSTRRRVLAATHHPFIVGMNYAFQTDALAVLVLDLVTGGDLQQAMNESRGRRLDERRVQFYTAEIILALNHLHDLGLMYRDLKPCNVLLCEVSSTYT
jgi:serine/threonine protein kinase